MKPPLVYSASEARARFADVFDAAWSGHTVIVTKRARAVAFVPVDVLERLAALAQPEEAPDAAV